MATLNELIAQGRIFFRRADWSPDQFIHLLWALQRPRDTLSEFCGCRAPAQFREELLDDDQWEPGGTPALEAAVETTELIAYDSGTVPPWQVGRSMEA